jgi:AraC family transcriptional activator of pobA
MTTAFSEFLTQVDDCVPPTKAAQGDGASEATLTLLLLKQQRNSAPHVVDPHLHEQVEQLIVVRRGGGTLRFEDAQQSFHAPAIIVVPSRKLHAFSYEENTERWVVTVAKGYFQEIVTRTPEFSEILAAAHCIQYLDHEREYAELEHVLGKLDWEQKLSARYREIATEALLIDLLVGILRKIQDSHACHTAQQGSYQDVHRRFIRMVEEHHTEHWSLQKFAAALGVTLPHLRAVCRSVTGESPIRLINARIVLEAQRCLAHTNLSVSEIAYRLGFEDPAYFARFFKSRCGQTPSLYKASRKGEPRVLEQSESSGAMNRHS